MGGREIPWDDLIQEESDPDSFEERARETYANGYELLLRKHQDYGPHNIGRSPGGALVGVAVRLHDKVARLGNLIDKRVAPTNESLRDTLVDIMNYGAIGVMVIDGKWPKE